MRALITGGAGFVDCNTVKRFHELNHEVTLLDNLSRRGSEQNLAWLREQFPNLAFVRTDVTDTPGIDAVVAAGRFDAVIHLAGQVAVTHSVADPRHDFAVNATETLNLLDAVRRHSPEAVFLYASTNKVYGQLRQLPIRLQGARDEFVTRPDGIDEQQPLDFYSPYGCSKGAADAYVTDYARIYGLRTASLRQSCIYGCRQFGMEDQGWVAWFIIAHLTARPITVCGDGRQVRDLLFVDDLVDGYVRAVSALRNGSLAPGRALNVGGGPRNTLSILEFFEILAGISGRRPEYSVAASRPGDQPVFVANTAAAKSALGWEPRIGIDEGVKRLYDWVAGHPELLARFAR